MSRTPLGGDELVQPREVALDGLFAVLRERAEVAVAAARRRPPRLGETLAQARPAPLEQREAGVTGEVPAERELQGEGLLLFGDGRVVAGEQLGEVLLAAGVRRYCLRVRRLGFGRRRSRAAAVSPSIEPVAGMGAGADAGAADPGATISIAPARSSRRSAG